MNIALDRCFQTLGGLAKQSGITCRLQPLIFSGRVWIICSHSVSTHVFAAHSITSLTNAASSRSSQTSLRIPQRDSFAAIRSRTIPTEITYRTVLLTDDSRLSGIPSISPPCILNLTYSLRKLLHSNSDIGWVQTDLQDSIHRARCWACRTV